MKGIIVSALIFLTLVAAKCNQDELDLNNAPFTVNSADGEKWIGGEEMDGEGYTISFQIDTEEGKKVQIDSVFYLKQTVALRKIRKSSRFYYVASVKANNKGTVSRKEFKDLNDVTAILMYRENGRKGYFMVTDIAMEDLPVFRP